MESSGVGAIESRRDGDRVAIRIARSLPEVEALREPWTGWLGSRDSEIDFYLMIIGSYPEVQRPHVIALYRNGKPDAILVGRLECKRITFDVGYLCVFRPRVRCLTFVSGAIRGNASPENTGILLREVINCLKQGEADIARLEAVCVDSPFYLFAMKLPGIWTRDTLPMARLRDVMIVPDHIDEVYRRMSHGRRHEVRRIVKKLQMNPAGEPRIVCYRSASELDSLFQDAEEIARKTYQRGLGVGFSDTPRVRKRLELAARSGWLRGYLLYLGERPCAFWICMVYGETLIPEYTGYDPAFRQSSPGLVLLMRVIERLCGDVGGDGIKEVDFGPGHAEYKEVFCSKSWREAVVHIFSPTPKGLLLKFMRTITRLADESARRILISGKLFTRLKRLWRNRLAEHGEALPGLKTAKGTTARRAAHPSARK